VLSRGDRWNRGRPGGPRGWVAGAAA